MKRTKQPKNKTKPEWTWSKMYHPIRQYYSTDITVFLTHLIDMQDYFESQNKLTPDGMFWYTHKQIMEEMQLSEHKIRNCKNQLRADGVLITKVGKSYPYNEYYKINMEVLKTVVNTARVKKLEGLRGKNIKGEALKKFPKPPAKIKGLNYTNNKNKKNNTPLCEEVEDDKIKIKHFDLFWKMYPKKNDQGKAKTEWNKLCSKLDRPEWRIVRQAIREQKETPRWKNTQFIPFPATWIKESRWLDDPKEMKEIKIQHKNSSIGISTGTHANGSKFKYKKEPDEVIN